MFGMGMPEILVILVLALIIIGPKKLPELAKSLGKALGEFKNATAEIKESLAMENEIDEIKESFKDTEKKLKESITSYEKMGRPEPVKNSSGPIESDDDIEIEKTEDLNFSVIEADGMKKDTPADPSLINPSSSQEDKK